MEPVAPKLFTYCICKFVFEFEGPALNRDILCVIKWAVARLELTQPAISHLILSWYVSEHNTAVP